jgi:hypothetical protein
MYLPGPTRESPRVCVEVTVSESNVHLASFEDFSFLA